MPRVLIAGCGYVGVATAELFRDRGWEVEGWTGSPESALALGGERFPVRAVDISDPHAVATAASGFDAVIQSVSSRGGAANVYRKIYKEGAKNLATACSGSRLLFISSTSVYGQTTGEWVTELSRAEPARETGCILRETEKFVLERGGVVARVAGIYGPNRSSLLRKFLDGTARITGEGNRFINQVHREDVVAALFVLVQHHLAVKEARDSFESRIFNVSDNNPLTERECYAALAAHFGREMPPSTAASVDRKRGNTNKRVSSEELQTLGWGPRFPNFRIGLRESVAPGPQGFGG